MQHRVACSVPCRAFKRSGDVVLRRFYDRSPYSMTNQGLSIEVRLEMAEPTFYHNYAGIFLAPLNCTRAAEGESKKALAIFVEGRSCTEANVNPNQYVSRFADTLLITDVSTWPYQCRC